MHRPTNFAAGAMDGLASLGGPSEILVTADELERVAQAADLCRNQDEGRTAARPSPSATTRRLAGHDDVERVVRECPT